MQIWTRALQILSIPTTLGLVSCLCLYLYAKKKYAYWRQRSVSYVKPSFPFGNLSFFSKTPGESIEELYKQFPEERYHGIFQFSQPVLLIKDPDLIKTITTKDFGSFTDRHCFFSQGTDPFFSNSLIGSNGRTWRELRTTLESVFSNKNLKAVSASIEECALDCVRHLKHSKHRKHSEWNRKQGKSAMEVELGDTFRRYCIDVIANVVFGKRCDSFMNRHNKFYEMGKDASSLNILMMLKFVTTEMAPFVSGLLRASVIPRFIRQYFTATALSNLRHNEKVTNDSFLNFIRTALIKNQQSDGGLNKTKLNEETVSNAMTFLIGGVDTTSNLLASFFYEVAVNPDVQKKLRDEVFRVNSSVKITHQSLLGMKYLDVVLLETLRKWPPVAFLDRKVTKSYTIQREQPWEKSLVLEEGTICWVPVFAIHRDPKLYPNPSRFDPERFSIENQLKIPQSIYLPFGIGPRSCIGSRFALLECKWLIFHILNEFEVISTDNTRSPGDAAKEGGWSCLKFRRIREETFENFYHNNCTNNVGCIKEEVGGI